MTEDKVFEISPEPDYVYQQYRTDIEIDLFFKTIDELIKDWYFGKALDKMWETRDLQDSMSNYMYFYARYYLGFIRPVKLNPRDFSTEEIPDNVINKYDTAMTWDNRFIWDDWGDNDPQLPLAQFLCMLRMIYDYSEVTWTYDLMMRYAAEMTNMSPNDIRITFEPNKVVFWLLRSALAVSFIAYTKQDEYKMNLPFADNWEFRIGSHRKNTNAIDEFMMGYMRPEKWPAIVFPPTPDHPKSVDPPSPPVIQVPPCTKRNKIYVGSVNCTQTTNGGLTYHYSGPMNLAVSPSEIS